MSLEWKIVKLKDLINLKTGKLDSNQEELDGIYPFFTCAPNPSRINSFSFDQKAILLAGNNANGNFHINYFEGKFDAYQRTYVISVLDEEKLDLKYLYYALKICLNDFKRMSQGTSTRFLTKKILDNFEIQVPPIETQLKIVNLLDNLTNKIEVNNQLNHNLESIATNIFKNYFIDYEPFQDLTLIDSNIGNIPKEWEFTKIEDIIDVKDGTHDSPPSIDEGFPLITSKHLNEYDVNKNEANKISFEDYTSINKRSFVEPFDILISMIGTVGNICYILYDEVDFAIKNVGLFKTSKTPIMREYLLLYLKSNIINQYIDSRLAGSTQKYISLTELRNIPIVIPPKEVLKEFKNVVDPIFNNIKTNHFEINNLINLRDALLPKLMSGEIDVSKVNCDLD